MIKRIYNTQTGDFIRDDFTYDPETESAYEGDIQGGLYLPRFDGTEWVEGLTTEEIEALKAQAPPQEPTEAERLEALEMLMVDILGGGF